MTSMNFKQQRLRQNTSGRQLLRTKTVVFTIILAALFGTLGAAIPLWAGSTWAGSLRAGSTAFAEPVDETQSEPSVEVISMTPEILEGQSQVTIGLHLSGFGEDEGNAIRATAFVRADPFTSEKEIDEFLQSGRDDGWISGEAVLPEKVVSAAATKAGANYSLTLEADELPMWNEDAWGPYGVTVRLFGLQSSAETGISPKTTSLLLWFPPGSKGDTEANVLLHDESQTFTIDKWTSLVRPGTTLALTPTELPLLAEDPASRDAEVAILPLENADLSLLAATGQQELYDLAAQSRFSLENVSREASAVRSITTVRNVVVATDPWFGLQTLDFAGADTVLSPAQGLPELFRGPLTPSAKYLLDDKVVLDSWGAGVTALLEDADTPAQEFAAAQKIRALSAVVTQEDSETPRDLWLNVPLTSAPENLAERLDALFEVPWMAPITLQEVLLSPASQIPRRPVVDTDTEAVAVAREQLSAVTNAYLRAHDVADASVDPSATLDPLVPAILSTAASRLTPQERGVRADEVVAQLEEINNVISIAPTSTITVVGRASSFPVTVTNSGDFKLKVQVLLNPSDPRLQPKDAVKAEIPANGNVTVQIPMTAVGTGDVEVFATAQTLEGADLATSEGIKVQVRADWEDAATWIFGSVLAAMFVLGLFRTLRKGRRTIVVSKKEELT